MRKYILLLIVTCSFAIYSHSQSFQIIVNKANPTTELSKKELINFFLKKNTKWNFGQKVIPVDLNPNSALRTEFSKFILNKSVRSIQSYWQQFVFSGKGTPPVEKRTEAEVIRFVKRNSGAIGYVSTKVNVSGVKIIKIQK